MAAPVGGRFLPVANRSTPARMLSIPNRKVLLAKALSFLLLLGALLFLFSASYAEDATPPSGSALAVEIYTLLTTPVDEYPAVRARVLERWRGREAQLGELANGLPLIYRTIAAGLIAELSHPAEYEQMRRDILSRLQLLVAPPVVSMTEALDPVPGFSFRSSLTFPSATDIREYKEDRSRAERKKDVDELQMLDYRFSLNVPDTQVTGAFLDEMLFCPAVIGEYSREVIARIGEEGTPAYVASRALNPLWEMASCKKEPLPAELAREAALRCRLINSPFAVLQFFDAAREDPSLIPLMVDRSDMAIPFIPKFGFRSGGPPPILRPLSEFFGVFPNPSPWMKKHPAEAEQNRKKGEEILKQGIQKPWELFPGEIPPSAEPSSPLTTFPRMPVVAPTKTVSLSPSATPAASPAPVPVREPEREPEPVPPPSPDWLIPAIILTAVILPLVVAGLVFRRKSG